MFRIQWTPGRIRFHIFFDRQDHLHRRNSRLDQPSHQRFIRGERAWRRLGIAAIIDGEIQKHEIWLLGKNIAFEPKGRKLRSGAPDGRIPKPEPGLRVGRDQFLFHQRPVGGFHRIG